MMWKIIVNLQRFRYNLLGISANVSYYILKESKAERVGLSLRRGLGNGRQYNERDEMRCVYG